MSKWLMQLSTGLPNLDRLFRGIMPGDNIVWQVDSIDDYRPFAEPYAKYARESRQKLIYFRFADHPPLLDEASSAEVHELHPENGFEPFIREIHSTVNQEGRGTLYLFDCLSQLAPDWKSDRMLGNFFMLTCPHLYDRAAIAYFAIFRNYHSFHAVRPISNTTQILLDVYRRKGTLYIQPIKVQHRHSSTMYMLHEYTGQDFVPVTQSATITETLADVPWSRSDASSLRLGFWSRTFAEAEDLQTDLDRGADRAEEGEVFFHKLLRMLISHDEPVLRLAEKYFTLRGLLNIRKRMIGTGLIGGKAVGMLLARAICCRENPRWTELLEPHDSFFVGADVFYTYLVQNGCWWMVQKYKQGRNDDDEIETVRRRILAGDFPEYIVSQFADMLDYFGQSPIIVRSSSLLEDNFGNAFAGKYESVFCANQGGQHKRLEDFLCAVRTVYASTMSEDALNYRHERGLLRLDEQMALLIQRVSGATYGSWFFPQAAGVGFSFNPYVWNDQINPNAGVIRLVFGIGTRAVDRADDDYTRVVALNAPFCRPESNFDQVKQYAQRRVDVLDLEGNQLTSAEFEDVVTRCKDIPMEVFASRDTALERRLRREGLPSVFSWVLTFEKLLRNTDFVADMRNMFDVLKSAYNYPVDVEFTLNFFDRDTYKINIVQCRPLQVQGESADIAMPQDIPAEDLILKTVGPVIGKTFHSDIDWLIYVNPAIYGELPVNDRYEVARVITDLSHHRNVSGIIVLIGPGRWGTTTPSLGVPVNFTGITSVSVLCELVMMRENLIPDASLGTHFFNEMVENDMLYLALYPDHEGNSVNWPFFTNLQNNRLPELLPEYAEWTEAIKVVSPDALGRGARIRICANMLRQQAAVFCIRETLD